MRRAATIFTLATLLGACGGGGGGSSPPAAATPAPAAAQPSDADLAARPRRLDVQPLSDQAVLVSWLDASSDETGFSIERRAAGATAWTVVGTAPANAQLFKDTNGLAGGSAYEYRVTAVRAAATAAAPTAAASATLPTATSPAVFFVDAAGGLDSNPGTESQPWATLQKAHGQLKPGQTVLVRAGTYTASNYAILAIKTSGAAGAPITYRGYPGERPLLRSTLGKNYHGIEIQASHIVIDGFDIQGHANEVTAAIADADLATHQAGKAPGPTTTSSGISVESRNSPSPFTHIVIRNNRVFDHPLAGISVMGADWVTVRNNVVSNVGRWSSYGGSAISVLKPRDSDANTSDYKLVIDGNQVSEAINDYPCSCYGFRQPTDGNGIILDLFNSSGYKGRTLVVNNLAFNNGARGIHVFKSGNADVVFNTTVRNATKQVTGDGEITVQESTGVRVFNNLMVARTDRPANSTAKSTEVDFSHNIVFGGTGFSSTGGPNRLNLDPLLQGGSGADAHRPTSASPAVNTAVATAVPPPATDAFGAPRPRGTAADVGAVEAF